MLINNILKGYINGRNYKRFFSNIVDNKTYKEMIELQINNQLFYLLDNDIEFHITISIKDIESSIDISMITNRAKDGLIKLVIGGETFESVSIGENHLYFTTGFTIDGENTEVSIKVPLLSIHLIMVNQIAIFINNCVLSVKPYFFEKEKKNSC